MVKCVKHNMLWFMSEIIVTVENKFAKKYFLN